MLWEEDFESGVWPYSGWVETVSSGSATVTATQVFHGSFSLEVVISVAGYYQAEYTGFTSQVRNTAFWRCFIGAHNQSIQSLKLRNSSSPLTAVYLSIDDARIYYYDGNTPVDTGLVTTNGRWNEFKAEFNTFTKTYSAWWQEYQAGVPQGWNTLCTDADFYDVASWTTEKVTSYLIRDEATTGRTNWWDYAQLYDTWEKFNGVDVSYTNILNGLDTDNISKILGSPL